MTKMVMVMINTTRITVIRMALTVTLMIEMSKVILRSPAVQVHRLEPR